jgi:signal transduction histidine kinase/CheY-like chemotaxis protein
LAVLPATLTAVLMTAIFLYYVIDNLELGLRSRGAAIARQMATMAEFGIFSGQRDSLLALTDSALRMDPDTRGAAILDAQGGVLARSGELEPSLGSDLVNRQGKRQGSDTLTFVEPVMRGNVAVDDIYGGAETPHIPESKLIGYVVVELSLRDVAVKSERLVAAGILIALLGAALGTSLSRRIARTVTVPLLEAGEVVARIGEGDLEARMRMATGSPLQSLAEGINDMATRIGVTQDDLRARVAEATLSLMWEKEAAERATVAKSHFLAAASHDLRQPLLALGLFVSRLVESDAAKLEPKLVAHIQSAVDTLQDLLDAILDVSRLNGGNVVPRMGSFPLGELLDRLARDLSPLAEQKGLQLRVRPTPVWVQSDEKIVARILLNLVGNALRYTQVGGVLVTCRKRWNGVRVEVWDTGQGIPEDAREEIFQEYVQLGNPERDLSKGLGLGLAICRRLSDLLAAPLGVRSRPGRGSVFWIQLPLASARPIPPVAEIPAEQAADSARIAGTVLLVEGDPLARAKLEQAILNWGGRVVLAGNREEALRLRREGDQPPDLVICNVSLPDGVDGIELAQELHRRFEYLGVLLIGSDVSAETQAAATAAGFVLLRQPVPPGRMRAALRQLLDLRA